MFLLGYSLGVVTSGALIFGTLLLMGIRKPELQKSVPWISVGKKPGKKPKVISEAEQARREMLQNPRLAEFDQP